MITELNYSLNVDLKISQLGTQIFLVLKKFFDEFSKYVHNRYDAIVNREIVDTRDERIKLFGRLKRVVHLCAPLDFW